MARTQSVSDEEILEAAAHVMNRRGFDGFTMADVAEEVGLSRAAIILRFQSTHALRIKVTERQVARFAEALEALPITRSGGGLIAFVRFIGAMNSEHGAVSFMMRLRALKDDPELAAIERKRIAAYDAAVSARMPKTILSHESAVIAFQANLGGSMLRLEQDGHADIPGFLEERTKEWLRLARIPFTVRAQKPAAKAAKRKAK